ncbi:MAG TPA: PF20097 family protein [Allosphingosinicella sp.]|nr:PF20097 family protein [Allosphingosinicella sp.]
MARSHTCPKCQSAMVEGFVLDYTYGAYSVSGWMEGAPEKSFWTGIKLRGKKPVEIATWRCRSCGFLESYAAG